jgi:hypothetical protein
MVKNFEENDFGLLIYIVQDTVSKMKQAKSQSESFTFDIDPYELLDYLQQVLNTSNISY